MGRTKGTVQSHRPEGVALPDAGASGGAAPRGAVVLDDREVSSGRAETLRASAGRWGNFKSLLARVCATVTAGSAGRARAPPGGGFGSRLAAALAARDPVDLRSLIPALALLRSDPDAPLNRRGTEREKISWVYEILQSVEQFPRPDRERITLALLEDAARLPAEAQWPLFEAVMGCVRQQMDFFQKDYWLRSAAQLIESLPEEQGLRQQAAAAYADARAAWSSAATDDTLIDLASHVGESPHVRESAQGGESAQAAEWAQDRADDRVGALLLAMAGHATPVRNAVVAVLTERVALLPASALRRLERVVAERFPEVSVLRARLASLRLQFPDEQIKSSDRHVVVRVWPNVKTLGFPTPRVGHAAMSVRRGEGRSDDVSWRPLEGKSSIFDVRHYVEGRPAALGLSYREDKRYRMSDRASAALDSGRYAAREGQKRVRHQGLAFDWGVSAEKVYLPVCGSATSGSRNVFGLSAAHMARGWADVLSGMDRGEHRYVLLSRAENCAGMVGQMLAAGGASLFAAPPRVVLYAEPRQVQAYAQRLRAAIDALNVKADRLIAEYERRALLLDDGVAADLEAALQAYGGLGLKPRLDVDPASADPLHLMAQAKTLTLVLDDLADPAALAVLYAIHQRLRELNESSGEAGASWTPLSLDAASPGAPRRVLVRAATRIRNWLSRSIAAILPGRRRAQAGGAWLLQAARQIRDAPEHRRVERFDFLLNACGKLELPLRAELLLCLARHIDRLPEKGAERVAALLDANMRLPPTRRSAVLATLMTQQHLMGAVSAWTWD
jgi:hypothetical protein